MPRVLLRHPVEADREPFVALRRASRAHLEPWEPNPPEGVDLYAPSVFDREIGLSDTEDQQRWLILREEDGVILGRIALSGIERGPFQNAWIGYWIGAQHAGKGYMTEAIARCLELSFNELKLHRVGAGIMPANAASRRVLERNGFVKVGDAEKYLQIRGVWEDHELWAITIERWAANRRAPS